MNSQKDFYMEPIVFINDASFLSGTGESMGAFDLIIDPSEAKRLLFEQNLPAPYACWNDFFSALVSNIILDKDYNNSQKDILANSKGLKGDALKENIRKRKAFLLRKKNGLSENKFYDDFVNDVSDEAIYMLNMVATQRYLYGLEDNSVLEEIFKIFKKGCLPCGFNRDKNILAVFNPISLK
ncbi:hypothetical protein [Erwinia sp. ErVv1]|uniref:hypothetical protein n=1 Tax=Erwinia sp. ErVv1 TaxID=1603299 RepID=UPI000836E21E|nr:hypothetical protein [Erwinia sp. ErVv1]